MILFTLIGLITAISIPSVNISPIVLNRLVSISLIYCALLSFNPLYLTSLGSGISIYGGLYHISSYSLSIECFIFIIASLILIPWAREKQNSILINNTFRNGTNILKTTSIRNPIVSEYSLIILFTTLGACLLISSSDLISMYLSIELQSFAVYILATIYRHSESSTSAGLKYFLLGGLSSCFILLGCGLLYSFTGLTQLEAIYSFLSCAMLNTSEESYLSVFNDISQGCILGLALIYIGFLFKISAAPLHNWAPDVYDEVPTIVTTWLTIMPKISIFIFLLELQSGISIHINSLSLNNTALSLLLISSFLSLIIGTVVGLAQSKIKRLLAYSTISHVGFLLLALSIGTEKGLESFIFYIIQYTITNLNTFFILLAFGYLIRESTFNKRKSEEDQDIRFISELKGQFIQNPLLSLSLAVCLLSMAGIPPLIGFFAKQQVLYSSIQNGYYFISFIAIITSVISASYYLKIIKVIHFDLDSDKISLGNPNNRIVPLQNSHVFVIATLTLVIILFIIKPLILLNSAQLLALSTFSM